MKGGSFRGFIQSAVKRQVTLMLPDKDLKRSLPLLERAEDRKKRIDKKNKKFRNRLRRKIDLLARRKDRSEAP